MRSVFAVIAGLAVAASALDLHAPAVRDEVIAAVNADPTSTWKAGRNPRLEGMTVREVKRLLGTRRDPEAMATHARLPKYAGPNLSALPSDVRGPRRRRARASASARFAACPHRRHSSARARQPLPAPAPRPPAPRPAVRLALPVADVHGHLLHPRPVGLRLLCVPRARGRWICAPPSFARNFDPFLSLSLAHVIRSASAGWAVSSTATFQDRLCIETKGSFNTLLSTQDTTSCCGGFACFGSDGCNGGQPAEAWSWFQSTGVVTGGEYIDMGTGKTCYPYALAECAHHTTNSTYPPCPAQEDPTPACSTSCTDPKYPTPFKNDAHFAKQSYSLNSVNDMMSDLVTNGPITVAFDVYEDFLSYTSGVYQHKTGQYLGGHAVELIGYGTENGTPYWLIKNSWNTSWGANGLFKIIRGRDECGIEDSAVSGL